jgi:DNA-binding XRE family transcriptional regulator
MSISVKEVLEGLTEEERKLARAEAARLRSEYLMLQELRKVQKMTQEELAEILKVRQATVAQMEKRSDPKLSTLVNYVEAMGCKLRLMVEFPDRAPVFLEGLGGKRK